jgi:hypothetical protein
MEQVAERAAGADEVEMVTMRRCRVACGYYEDIRKAGVVRI